MTGNSFTPVLSHSEIQNIESSRNSLRLAQPAKCFLYRHIQESKFHLFIQSLTALISIGLLLAAILYSLFAHLNSVYSFGLVDDSTVYEKLAIVIVGFIFIKKAHSLIKSTAFSKRTKVALFCNAVNLFVWVNILCNLALIFVLVWVPIAFSIVDQPNAYKLLEYNYIVGIAADVLSFLYSTFFMFFAWFVCRHFSRGTES